MKILKCARCRHKLMKYNKIGKGRIVRCWHDRIIENYAVREGDELKCVCGAVIGTYDARGIRLRQNSFTASGRAA